MQEILALTHKHKWRLRHVCMLYSMANESITPSSVPHHRPQLPHHPERSSFSPTNTPSTTRRLSASGKLQSEGGKKGKVWQRGGHCGPHRPHPPHTPGPQASGLSPDARVLPGGGLCPRVVRTSNAPGRRLDHALRNIHDASPTTNAMLVRMNLKLMALVCGVARSAIRAFNFFARQLM